MWISWIFRSSHQLKKCRQVGCEEEGRGEVASQNLKQAQEDSQISLAGTLHELSYDLLLLLQGTVIFPNEVADLVGHPEQLSPLLFIKRDREAPKPVYGQTTLLANLQRHLPSCRFLQCFVLGTKPFNLCFQIFV